MKTSNFIEIEIIEGGRADDVRLLFSMKGSDFMSNSALVSYTKISPNKNSPRNHAIDTISIHCVVGQLSVESIGNIFAPSSAGCSANYGIGADGRIGMYVEEKDRSWCTSSSANDNRAITIECASDTTSPYAVNDKVYKALINLLVDICQRNGIKSLKWQANKALIGQVDKQNMTFTGGLQIKRVLGIIFTIYTGRSPRKSINGWEYHPEPPRQRQNHSRPAEPQQKKQSGIFFPEKG